MQCFLQSNNLRDTLYINDYWETTRLPLDEGNLIQTMKYIIQYGYSSIFDAAKPRTKELEWKVCSTCTYS